MATLVAQQSILESGDYWLTVVLMFGVLLLGVVVYVLIDRWRKRYLQARPLSGEQLSHFKTLYEQGEMSREEFDRVRTLLGQRLREELDVSAPSAPAEEILARSDLTRKRQGIARKALPPAAGERQARPPESIQPSDPEV